MKRHDLIRFVNGNGCSSHVARQGGEQELSLNRNDCFTNGVILHELMHAIGFEHEQSRYDRDQYVIIHWDNIPIDKRHNFERKEEFTTRFGSYDYSSIMHYNRYSFSSNGECTISSYNKTELSQGDINGLRRANNLSNWTTRETHGAYSNEATRDMERSIANSINLNLILGQF